MATPSLTEAPSPLPRVQTAGRWAGRSRRPAREIRRIRSRWGGRGSCEPCGRLSRRATSSWRSTCPAPAADKPRPSPPPARAFSGTRPQWRRCRSRRRPGPRRTRSPTRRTCTAGRYPCNGSAARPAALRPRMHGSSDSCRQSASSTKRQLATTPRPRRRPRKWRSGWGRGWFCTTRARVATRMPCSRGRSRCVHFANLAPGSRLLAARRGPGRGPSRSRLRPTCLVLRPGLQQLTTTLSQLSKPVYRPICPSPTLGAAHPGSTTVGQARWRGRMPRPIWLYLRNRVGGGSGPSDVTRARHRGAPTQVPTRPPPPRALAS